MSRPFYDLHDDEDEDDAFASPSEAPRLKARLGVVVINYRTPELVRDCLESLGPQLDDVDARVVVVDNFSNDGSADAIAAFLDADKETQFWKARVNLVRSKTNTGFSGGNNIGVGFLDADFYMLLNSDALARPGALAAMLEAAQRHPEAGVIGPRLESADGAPQRNVFRFPSPMSEFLAGARLSALDAVFRFALVSRPIMDEPARTHWVSFACALLRREAIEAAGLMDEGFFMYFEDADYCRAIRKAGFAVIHDPAPRFVHLRGGSSPVKSAMRAGKRPPAYYYASRTRFFRKAYGPLGPTAANVAWMTGRLLARVRLLAGRPTPQAVEGQAADHWLNWARPLGDRRAPVSASVSATAGE